MMYSAWLAVLISISAASAYHWQDGGSNVKWALGCDFKGNDINCIAGPGEQCGDHCASNPQCTHFTWFNNNCYLKNAVNPTASDLNGGVCGWVNRGGNQPTNPGNGNGAGTGVELTVKNNCGYTTFLVTTPNSDHSALPVGTIQLTSGESYTYQIPSGGWAGRFW